MPNTENINRLIAVLEADDGTHFLMSGWAQWLGHVNPADYPAPEGYILKERERPSQWVECGTACCLAGWVNVLRADDVDPNWRAVHKGQNFALLLHGERTGTHEWLGITSLQAEQLFRMSGSRMGLCAFDRLLPTQRKRAGIRVLEILRDTGDVDWDNALDYAVNA